MKATRINKEHYQMYLMMLACGMPLVEQYATHCWIDTDYVVFEHNLN